MGERKIEIDAKKAYNYDAKARIGGGYKLTHKPSSYGIAIKWLMKTRGMTYSEFAFRYNRTSAQNINHLINRLPKERFFEEYVEKVCKTLGTTVRYFTDLCEEIEKLMVKE